MQCPECQSDNRQEAKFCSECGCKFELVCPECGNSVDANSKFCDECGCKLSSVSKASDTTTEPAPPSHKPPEKVEYVDGSTSVGERKHVTVLFSDLTGYTAMSEKLDPEDVKEITSRIFGEISKIVASYDGFIEKYAGDAVMAIFGVPQAHEDDPIRGIKAAREIHRAVDAISPEIEKKIGQSISMHSGINTGLVVTGEVNLERGTHGVAGDTINLAARLSGLAKPGEILVNADTCRQAEGHFECEFHEATTVKGKAERVEVHKVLSERESPVTIRRLSGVRADLVGRSVEMAELTDAVDKLKQGKGRIFSICGAAGTGKSRLVEEFKAGLDLEKTKWIECHAYAYSQDIPYFPLVDLLNRLLQIDEKDPPATVREKIESGLTELVGNRDDIIPYVGGLYSLSYPQTKDVSPEFWKTRLQEAILVILSTLAEKSSTVFFIEDLHWADPSFVELLRRACVEIRTPALLLCAYRPTFSLFTGHQLNSIGDTYHEIKLENLSLTTAQHMLASLLKTDDIPQDLKRWVNSKAEGNPFYLEELVNSLIESETLSSDKGHWQLARPLTEADIPSSLHGLITGRVDRLEKQTKRILQEASVIGRDFLYEILIRITELEERIDGELSRLERLDLIRTRSLQPEIEYMFKHALTQEVVYNSLLKKERREIHEKIAEVIETVFKDRLAEFNETLAYHYIRGQSVSKAIDFLILSGKKCLTRYAIDDADQYFRKAYELISFKKIPSELEKNILINILNVWGYSFYYSGEFNQFIKIFSQHRSLADSLEDSASTGMFYAWYGIAHVMAGKAKDSYEYLTKGLKLGEQSGNKKVAGYASTWLTIACAEMGLFSEGIDYGENALSIAKLYPSDPYLYFKSLYGVSWNYLFMGNTSAVFEKAEMLLSFGEKHVNSRSKVFGYWMKGFAYYAVGDMGLCEKYCKKAMEVALDPYYTEFPKIVLGFAYIASNRLKEAEEVLQSALKFSAKRSIGIIASSCQYLLGAIYIANGRMSNGMQHIKDAQEEIKTNKRALHCAISEFVLGEVHASIAIGEKPSAFIMLKNIGFLSKYVPFASNNAEKHYLKSVKIFRELGAKCFLGIVLLSFGVFYREKKKYVQSQQHIQESIEMFRDCEADGWLKKAEEALLTVR